MARCSTKALRPCGGIFSKSTTICRHPLEANPSTVRCRLNEVAISVDRHPASRRPVLQQALDSGGVQINHSASLCLLAMRPGRAFPGEAGRSARYRVRKKLTMRTCPGIPLVLQSLWAGSIPHAASTEP